MSFFNSEEIIYKPPDMSLMGRMIKMKFHVQDTGIDQYFTGKIVNYDGCSGKYGVYFPSDGEIVYMHPDVKDVVFLTSELACTCNVGWVKKVHYVYKDLLLFTMLSFIMIELMINAAFLFMYYDSSLLIVH